MRPRCVLVGLIGLHSSSALAEECRLHVDAGALSARMIALLEKEVPRCEVVTSSGAATLSLAIMRAEGHLDVDMTALPATPVLARRVAIDEGDPEPALRRIALLAARAVESSYELEPFELSATVEQPAEEQALGLSVGASFVTQWWASPSRASFAPALALTIDVSDFDAGLWVAWFVPHDRDVAGVEAHATELALLLRGAWRPIHVGPIAIGLELGGGANVLWLGARPGINLSPGRADETNETAVEGLVRGGVVVEGRLVGERLHLFARGGGLLRIGQVQLQIPTEYGGEPIRTGLLRPWLELGLAVRFF